MFCWIFIFSILSALTGAQYAQNEELDWWQKIVIYQIYPKSFLDSDGSGIGDLKGIEQKVDYFKNTGIGAVWFSSIYKSPQVDSGYDVSNFMDIDQIFGGIEDFTSSLKKFQSKGIKVIMDFVPNHTSDEHEWFKKSVKKIDPYTEYYVWKDPKGWLNETTPIPPNNWQSLSGGPAWKYVKERKQFYLHQFIPQQVDLNYRCPHVLEEMKNVLRFYLDRGINGFRCDAVPFLVEDGRFLDEPLINGTAADGPITYDSLRHIYTMDLPQTYDVLSQFREVLDSYTKKGGPTRILLVEAYTDIKHTMKYYGTPQKPIAQIPFNFFLITNLNDSSNAKAFADTVHLFLDNVPEGRWPNWVIGNHDRPRVPTRFDPSFVDALNILLLLLPGTAVTYQGEEIGMEDTNIRPDQTVDVITPSRDPERTPFQWNSSLNAGFSSNTSGTWLPVNPNYPTLNLQQQMENLRSHYKIYTQLVDLRSTSEFLTGDFSTCTPSEWIFSFTRSLPGKNLYLIVINVNNEQDNAKFKNCSNIPNFYKKFVVQIASTNSEYKIGDPIDLRKSFKMRPKSAVVLKSTFT